MIKKQDRHGARTPEELNRRLGKVVREKDLDEKLAQLKKEILQEIAGNK